MVENKKGTGKNKPVENKIVAAKTAKKSVAAKKKPTSGSKSTKDDKNERLLTAEGWKRRKMREAQSK